MSPRTRNLPLIGIVLSLPALIGFIFGARVMLDADREISLLHHPEWPIIVLSGFILWHFTRKPIHLLSFCERIDSRCPYRSDRRLLLLYLFRKERRACPLEPMNYQPRPQVSLKERILVGVDRGLVRAFSFAKRYAKLKDGIVDRILKHF